MDPVDEIVVLRDREWLFVDTAGIRRKIREASGHEYYASLRTHAALEKAEVAVVLVDGGEPMSEQDLRITSMVVDAGRALVLAINKWDLVDEERRRYLEREIERDLAPVAWAPRVNVSARTGRAVDKLVPAIDAALAGWETRVPTGRLNQFLAELVAAHPHPLRGGKQPRILFGTQAAIASADVRPVHDRLPRGRLPAVRRAAAARGVRLRGHADPDHAADPGEARAGPLTPARYGADRHGRSDGPRDLPGQREQSAHESVATVRGLAEHQRAPAVDDGDPGRAAQFGRLVGDAARRRRPDASRRGRPPVR